VKEKFIIYQVLPRLFGNTNPNCVPNSSLYTNGSGKFSTFDEKILKSIRELGCTHIWLTGIIEHATKTDYSKYNILKDNNQIVKGEAGSPYAIKDYYDVDPDLADSVPDRLTEFKDLVKRVHDTKMKVIIDFVPNHLAREYHSDSKPDKIEDFGSKDKIDYAFHPMNNFYYILHKSFISPISSTCQKNIYNENPAKASGNDCFKHNPEINDWFETIKLNYGVDYLNNKASYFNPVPDTWKKMKEVLTYWLNMGIDGFRCDMAEMIPPEFWKYTINHIKNLYPESVFIGEVYNPYNYDEFIDIGFDYLYDKVGLYDTLKLITKGEISASRITECWQSLGDKQDKMLNFIENHDEVRVASDFYAGNPYAAIPALTVSLMLNNAPFMLYFAQELGERGMDSEGFSTLDGKTTIYDYWSLKSIREWTKCNKNPDIRDLYMKLLNIAINEPAIFKGNFFDLGYVNMKSEVYNSDYHYSFLRCFNNEIIIIAVNFSELDSNIQINIPRHAFEYFGTEKRYVESGFDLIDSVLYNEPLTYACPFKIFISKKGIRIIKYLLQ